MPVTKPVTKKPKSSAKPRPLHICALSATILGRLRITTTPDGYSSAQLTMAFPNFNILEVTHALQELIEKRLLKQKGHDDHAVYSITDHGREAHVTIS